MKTRQITVIVAIMAMTICVSSCSWFGGSKDKDTEQQVAPPAPQVTEPIAGKDLYRDLKQQQRKLKKELKKMQKDCQWQKKAEALEKEIEEIQDAIDDFDCDNGEIAPTPKAPAPAPAKKAKSAATISETPAVATVSETPAASAPDMSNVKLDPGYYDGDIIRFCIRIGRREDLWLPQRLKMDLNKDVQMEDNGIKGNNWVLAEPNGTGPDENKAVFTADGKFIIPAWMVEQVAAKNGAQPLAELKTTKTGWQPTAMRREGNFYIYP